jgi:hypothetical protein
VKLLVKISPLLWQASCLLRSCQLSGRQANQQQQPYTRLAAASYPAVLTPAQQPMLPLAAKSMAGATCSTEQPTTKPKTVNSCIPPCFPDTCSALPCCLLQLCRPAAAQEPHIAGRLLLLCRTALAQLPSCCCCAAHCRLCKHSSWLHAVQKSQR